MSDHRTAAERAAADERAACAALGYSFASPRSIEVAPTWRPESFETTRAPFALRAVGARNEQVFEDGQFTG